MKSLSASAAAIDPATSSCFLFTAGALGKTGHQQYVAEKDGDVPHLEATGGQLAERKDNEDLRPGPNGVSPAVFHPPLVVFKF